MYVTACLSNPETLKNLTHMLVTIFTNDLGSPLFTRDFLPTLVVRLF
jgi:hypothetical protein